MNKNTECRKVFIHAVDISKMHVLNPKTIRNISVVIVCEQI